MNRPLPAALVPLALFVLLVAAGPLLWPHSPGAIDLAARWQLPSWLHPLGTDGLGRDILSRVLAGLRLSLLVAVLAVAAALGLGVPLGAAGGYVGGGLDAALMRLMDALYALPYPVLAILLTAALGQGLPTLFLVLFLFSWQDAARIVRGHVRRLKGGEFVLAARAMGAGTPWVVRRHLLPNLAREVLSATLIAMRDAVFMEALLSFLGLGAAPPRVSLGTLIVDGGQVLRVAPWEAAAPAAALALTLLSFHVLADVLGNAGDPRTSPRRRPSPERDD